MNLIKSQLNYFSRLSEWFHKKRCLPQKWMCSNLRTSVDTTKLQFPYNQIYTSINMAKFKYLDIIDIWGKVKLIKYHFNTWLDYLVVHENSNDNEQQAKNRQNFEIWISWGQPVLVQILREIDFSPPLFLQFSCTIPNPTRLKRYCHITALTKTLKFWQCWGEFKIYLSTSLEKIWII